MTPSLRAKAVRLKTEDLTLDVDIRFYSNLISARFHTLWVIFCLLLYSNHTVTM